LETALFSIDRDNFFCINRFDLSTVVTIEFQDNGNFTVLPADCLTQDPIDKVMPFMIRTSFCHSLRDRKDKSDVKQTTTATIRNRAMLWAKDHDEDFQNLVGMSLEQSLPLVKSITDPWKQATENNIFHYTTFNLVWAYECFHPSVQRKRDELRVSTGKNENDEITKSSPEMYHVVMVTSCILQRLFREDWLESQLREHAKKKKIEYEAAFGSLERAYDMVPYMEVPPVSLPVGDSIPWKSFRRSISTRITAVASFFALAIHDERTFNIALVLLMSEPMKTGAPMPHEEYLFPNEFWHSDIDHRLGDKNADFALFRDGAMDWGTDFIKNGVDVLNRFAYYLSTTSYLNVYKNVYEKKRIQSILFRTLASDLVEIYVSHGLYPRMTQKAKSIHPSLIDLIKKHPKMTPIAMIFEYLILAMDNKMIEVKPSHVYQQANAAHIRDGKRQLMDATTGKRPRAITALPGIKNIRCLFDLVGSEVQTGGPHAGRNIITAQEKKKGRSLTLVQVVNVILLGIKDPWITEKTDRVWINWDPKFPEIPEDGIVLWTKTDEKTKNTKSLSKHFSKIPIHIHVL
jgi:hypothetical protein